MQKIYIKGVNKNAPGTNYDQQHSNGTLSTLNHEAYYFISGATIYIHMKSKSLLAWLPSGSMKYTKDGFVALKDDLEKRNWAKGIRCCHNVSAYIASFSFACVG